MTWNEICSYAELRRIPYKIEMSRWGNIEASPLGANHGKQQARIAQLLQRSRPDGVVATQVPVATDEYVKVSDVIWASRERQRATSHDPVWDRAPEVCVEIVTPDDPPEEGRHKARLYFKAGATEFWICNERGEMRFYNVDGSLDRSWCCPEFPTQVEIAD